MNDAFGTMHQAHASTYGAAQLFADRLAGFLVRKEMDVLSQVRDRPARPFRVVVGGIKIWDKLSALKALLPKADTILLGGGIAYTFLAAQGVATGDSPVEPEFIPGPKTCWRSIESTFCCRRTTSLPLTRSSGTDCNSSIERSLQALWDWISAAIRP